MKWVQLPLGPLQTNAYVIRNEEKECLIFDPGHEGEKLLGYLRQEGLQPLAVLLTHAHFDHIGAVDAVREAYHIPVYLHEEEAEWLADPSLNGSALFMMNRAVTAGPADELITGKANLKIGPFSLEVRETPGHSPGSVSYYMAEAGLVVSGDALFQMSIGRTDLPGGSFPELIGSIEEKLFTLPEETVVLCGHGPETTIGFEKAKNPFLT
ncbi:MBL fold metallo-hydrolase [Ectobacillus ponti]|uniref:MBL fold metallo-hydrolase n=1 Tax=Ectobacillus ponti TaxID=2961894 RepID=A0AA42BR73_9BACI|nr:MBL fold metallo-hydrolase [Ectobacillus ponti]MCP8967123.1 MBL fold metallo-hydrolase [Ectobacillus ponti]